MLSAAQLSSVPLPSMTIFLFLLKQDQLGLHKAAMLLCYAKTLTTCLSSSLMNPGDTDKQELTLIKVHLLEMLLTSSTNIHNGELFVLGLMTLPAQGMRHVLNGGK